MAKRKPLVRQSLHHELVPLLRDMIIGGALRPGDKIQEGPLCDHFGVSRTPLREALKVLASEGLVELPPNRGAVVATISAQEINELFPIMGVLEALAGELATQRMKPKDLKRLTDMHQTMLGHYERGESGPYVRLNKAIHEALFDIAGNEALTAIYQNLMVRIHSVRYVAKKSQARWDEAVDDHNRLMAALERGDSAGVGAVLREHLSHKAEMIHEVLASEEPEFEESKLLAAAG